MSLSAAAVEQTCCRCGASGGYLVCLQLFSFDGDAIPSRLRFDDKGQLHIMCVVAQLCPNMGLFRHRYITVNEDNGRALYYTLAESQTNALEHPLVLWLNG